MKRDQNKIINAYKYAYRAANGKDCEIIELPRKRFQIDKGFNGAYYLSDIERLTENLLKRVNP